MSEGEKKGVRETLIHSRVRGNKKEMKAGKRERERERERWRGTLILFFIYIEGREI